MGRVEHPDKIGAVRLTKTNIIAAIAAVLIAVPGGFLLLNRNSSTPSSPSSAPVAEEEPKQSQEVASAQTEIKPDYIRYQGETGETALDLLKKHTDVQTETYDFGELVSSVNGEDGGGEKYWIFYVNGEMASVGAGDYETADGEKIEWRLE